MRLQYILVKRWIKMMQKPKFPWNILNIPYNIVEYSSEYADDDCAICQESLNSPMTIASFPAKDSDGNPIQGSKLHNKCLCEYISHQINAAERDYEFAELRCPYKSVIRFNRCRVKDWKKYTAF